MTWITGRKNVGVFKNSSSCVHELKIVSDCSVCPIKSPELGFCYFGQSWVWTQIFTNNKLKIILSFRNTKEIWKNTKKKQYQFCVGHGFLTISAINLNP